MTYLVYGKEVGEKGTPHHQGFVVFKNQKRLSNMKDINGQAHWEIKSNKSTFAEASDYCKKDGDFVEYGTLPVEPRVKGNEANSDKWRSINDKAKEGDLDWIDQKYPKVFNQSYKNLKQMKVDYMKRKPNLDAVCGTWYYGPSGVGKTNLTTTLYPDAYLKRAQNKWFDAYQQEEVIVVDDLDDSHAYMGYELKKLADRYCYMVEVKNSSMYIRPKKCVVTSQYKIEEIWKNDPKTIEALTRRFTQVEVTKENRDMLAKCQSIIDESRNTIMDDITADQFDTLVVEAELEKMRNAKTIGARIAKQNKEIAMKKVNFDRMPKKMKPKNVYFPDAKLQLPVPLVVAPPEHFKKALERKNAMTTPPIPKPDMLPPPAPKRLKRKASIEIVEVHSSDSEPEECDKYEEMLEYERQYYEEPEYYDNPYESHSLEEMYCDEDLSDSENNSSDEY